MRMRTWRGLRPRRRNRRRHFNSANRVDHYARRRRLEDLAAGGGEKLRPFIADAIIQHMTERTVGRSNAEAGASKAEAKIVQISLAVLSPNDLGVRPNCGET
jgi:hypothetical protein